MSFETTLYDAFTGMNAAEKSAVINFLFEKTENATKSNIREAVEYALKNKPSFGGFVLTAHVSRQLIGAIVVNRTGMEGYNPNNLFVYVAFHEDCRHDETTMLQILKKAIDLTDGDIALHVEPRNPVLRLYKKIGFEAQYLELRFPKKQPVPLA